MSSGTLHNSLEAGAARPVTGCQSALLLEHVGGFTPAVHTHQLASAQTWMKVWNVRPAYPVIATDRPAQRPLERSP